MSQQKDSDSGANLEKPTSESVPEPTPDASWADVATSETFQQAGADTESVAVDDAVDAVTEQVEAPVTDETDTAAAESAEPTVVLDKPAASASVTPPATPDSELPPKSDIQRFALFGSVVLLAASVVAAAVVGFLWFGDHRDDSRASARDAALTDARQAAVNLMSINPDDIDGSLANIRSSMTGDLLKQQEDGQDQLKQTAQDSKTRIQADVEGLTLTSLNSELDHASAFAVLKITRSWPGGQPATFRQLWTLDMVKVGSTWKAEKAQNLGEPVPLGSAAPQQDVQQPTSTPKPGN